MWRNRKNVVESETRVRNSLNLKCEQKISFDSPLIAVRLDHHNDKNKSEIMIKILRSLLTQLRQIISPTSFILAKPFDQFIIHILQALVMNVNIFPHFIKTGCKNAKQQGTGSGRNHYRDEYTSIE